MQIRHQFWLIALIIALLLPAPTALADTTVEDSLTITASVASLVVADISGVSPNCTLLQPDRNRLSNRDHHNDPTYCVLKTPISLHVLSNEQWSVMLTVVNTGNTNAPSHACLLHFSSVKPVRYQDAAVAPRLSGSPTFWLKQQPSGESSSDLYLILAVPAKSKIAKCSANLTLTVTQKTSGLQYSISVPITFKFT